MIGGPAFGLENFGDSSFVAGIGRQTINCFSWQTQELACAQSIGCLLHMRGVIARNDHELMGQVGVL
jgi:hypothetical protein